MKTKNFGIVAVLAVGVLALSGCGNTEAPAENSNENAEIANPASIYCEENGGTLNLEE
jgi:putative hemolysin